MTKQYRCMQCLLQGRQYMKSPECFDVRDPTDLYSKLLLDGLWTRCTECRESMKNLQTITSEATISEPGDTNSHTPTQTPIFLLLPKKKLKASHNPTKPIGFYFLIMAKKSLEISRCRFCKIHPLLR